MHLLLQVLMVALMVFGFGFVVFFHELGHFLAAKWVGIRVEQFAVGFGQALVAWRKGIGWRAGTTNKEMRRRAEEYLKSKSVSAGVASGEVPAEYTDDEINKAADELGLGETEYRLNWIPLGGYVKMLGQDDLKANAGMDDPRAYNRKGIPQRMLVVSAGVVMNIILAAIGFMAVFVIGFDAPPPVVGHVITGSPAQRAGLRVGDRILTIDGTRQYDFNRIVLSAALLKANTEVSIEIERPDPANPSAPPKKMTLRIRPAEMDGEIKVLGLGIGQSQQLATAPNDADDSRDLGHLPDFDALKPGETITAIEGKPVGLKQYYVLFDALQNSHGKPVEVTVRGADGKERTASIQPYLDQVLWGNRPVTVAGMEPRPMIDMVLNGSSAAGKLKAGDVITGIRLWDQDNYPGREKATKLFAEAADAKHEVSVTVVRDGKELPPIGNIVPKMKLEGKKRGMGLALGYENAPVISTVVKDSPAGRAGVPSGTAISAVDGKPVDNWFQVRDALETVGKHEVAGTPPGEAKTATYSLDISAADVEGLKALQAQQLAALQELKEPRKTHNPIEAASWGLVETRDFVLQFYVTLQRMFQGSVPVNSMMGPLGIVTSGARFAFKGAAWLIWFLSMISANLAVVNFLPIPIVDGGLFTFLLLEKIQGKPLSPKVQAVFQIVGFALIISVFLLVTFQDIRRTIGF